VGKISVHHGRWYDKYIPKGRPSRTGTHKNFQPFTAQLRALIREKQQLWNCWMNSREDEIFKEI